MGVNQNFHSLAAKIMTTMITMPATAAPRGLFLHHSLIFSMITSLAHMGVSGFQTKFSREICKLGLAALGLRFYLQVLSKSNFVF